MSIDLSNNPFTVLSAVAAPAILTNACSVLALGTGNRIARVVDRSRVVFGLQAGVSKEEHEQYAVHLHMLGARSKMLLRALRLFYAALGMFATTALTAIIGSAFVGFDITIGFRIAAIFGLVIGCAAVCAVVAGCSLMVRETRLAIRSLEAERRMAMQGAQIF